MGVSKVNDDGSVVFKIVQALSRNHNRYQT